MNSILTKSFSTFNTKSTALKVAANREKLHGVIDGEDGFFYVVKMVDFERAIKAGFKAC